MFLEVDDLAFKYNNSEQDVLKNISFDVQQGDIVCILGESGSGKSTVLRLLAGLEKPSKGRIEIDDQLMVNNDIFILPENRGIGVVFQDYALFPHMTVAENILFGIKDKAKEYKEDKLHDLLELIGLKEHKAKYPHQLSGGQQQRIALARSLAIDPSLVVMDEPFSSLDANLQSQIRGDLKEIMTTTGTTSIFVSHDKDDAINIADRIIVLEEGKIVQNGTTEEIMNNPSSDYVAGLIS
ncbi:MAG: ABC transporter ATP-binding protein [Bacillota bacterium]